MVPCRFLDLLDARCLPARLTSLNAEDLVYFCGRHPERCPHRVALEQQEQQQQRQERAGHAHARHEHGRQDLARSPSHHDQGPREDSSRACSA